MSQAIADNDVFEIEADSLKAARAEAESRIPSGLGIVSEKILCDGNTKSEEGIGETPDEAIAAARKRIPPGARIVEEKLVKDAHRSVVEADAFDLESATKQVTGRIRRTARIEGIELVTPGRKGFLGLGKKPHWYQAKVFHPAVAQVQYKFAVKIRVEVGDPKKRIYRNGDMAACGQCGKSIRVQYQDSAKIAVVDPKAVQSIALRCQGCGFVVCFGCAVGPSGEGIPVCPSCHAQGGPYFFHH